MRHAILIVSIIGLTMVCSCCSPNIDYSDVPTEKEIREHIKHLPKVPSDCEFAKSLDIDEACVRTDNSFTSSCPFGTVFETNLNSDDYTDFVLVGCGASSCESVFYLGNKDGLVCEVGAGPNTIPAGRFIEGNTVFGVMERSSMNECPESPRYNSIWKADQVFDGENMVVFNKKEACLP